MAWPKKKKKKKPVTKHTLGRHLNLTVMECFCELFGDLPAHNGGPSLGFSDMAKVSFTKLDSCMPTNEVRTIDGLFFRYFTNKHHCFVSTFRKLWIALWIHTLEEREGNRIEQRRN